MIDGKLAVVSCSDIFRPQLTSLLIEAQSAELNIEHALSGGRLRPDVSTWRAISKDFMPNVTCFAKAAYVLHLGSTVSMSHIARNKIVVEEW